MLGAPSFRSFIAEGWETTGLPTAKSKQKGCGIGFSSPTLRKVREGWGCPFVLGTVKVSHSADLRKANGVLLYTRIDIVVQLHYNSA